QRLRMSGQVAVLSERKPTRIAEAFGRVLADAINVDHPPGISDRPRPQGNCVEGGKQARVQADCAPQSGQRNNRETRLPTQVAYAVHHVLPYAFQPRPDPYRAGLFARASAVAQLAPAD